jgi:calcium-dependent protein kinase
MIMISIRKSSLRSLAFLVLVSRVILTLAWDKISSDVKDLIKKMICDPKERYTAEQVLNHTWVTKLAPNSQEVVLELNIDNMKLYRNQTKLKKAVLIFIASRLNEKDIKNLKEIFDTLDKNKDGTLTLEEIKAGIGKLTDDKDVDVEELFKSIDTDGSGAINYTEFLASTMDQNTYLKEEKLYEAFRAFDKDGSGKISTDEVRSVMKGEDVKKIEEMIKKYDQNGDGEIDYAEFMSMMSKLEI